MSRKSKAPDRIIDATKKGRSVLKLSGPLRLYIQSLVETGLEDEVYSKPNLTDALIFNGPIEEWAKRQRGTLRILEKLRGIEAIEELLIR